MDMYINGVARPDSEKSTGTHENTGSNTGQVDIGRALLDNTNVVGNMWMDELVFWEVRLPAEEVTRLYQAYL